MAAPGTISARIWSRFGIKSPATMSIPVKLPSGRLKCLTSEATLDDDRNSHRRLHCGHCRPHSADGRNDLDTIANKLGRQARQPSIIAVGPAVLDRQIAAFDIAGLVEPPTIICKEGFHIICG